MSCQSGVCFFLLLGILVVLIPHHCKGYTCSWKVLEDTFPPNARDQIDGITSLNACQERCDERPDCVAVTHGSPECYIYTSIPAPVKSPGWTHALKLCTNEISTPLTTDNTENTASVTTPTTSATTTVSLTETSDGETTARHSSTEETLSTLTTSSSIRSSTHTTTTKTTRTNTTTLTTPPPAPPPTRTLPSGQTSTKSSLLSSISTTTQSTVDSPANEATGVPVAVIAGAVGAAVALIIVGIIVVLIVMRKRRGRPPYPGNPAAGNAENRAHGMANVTDNSNTTDAVTPAAEHHRTGDRDPTSTTENVYEITEESGHYYEPLSHRDNTYINDNILYSNPVFTNGEEGGGRSEVNSVSGGNTTYYNTGVQTNDN